MHTLCKNARVFVKYKLKGRIKQKCRSLSAPTQEECIEMPAFYSRMLIVEWFN